MVEKFLDATFTVDAQTMLMRFKHLCSGYGWQELIRFIMHRKGSLKGLRIAEVGCGTGTLSLSLEFLGAECTLIDADEDALNAARMTFGVFDRSAEYISGNVLDTVPMLFRNSFDIVLSSGLAEHFIGDEREQCLRYHKELLKEGGIAYIGVPNRLCFPYRFVRSFREFTKTWHIELEEPFTHRELHELGKKAGFQNTCVIGNHSTLRDVHIYGLGFISAVLDLLPLKTRSALRSSRLKRPITSAQAGNDAVACVQSAYADIKGTRTRKNKIKDHYSSGLILLATA